jgi:hypothetical protein
MKKSDPECGSYMHDPDPESRVHILNFFFTNLYLLGSVLGSIHYSWRIFHENNCFRAFFKAYASFFLLIIIQCCGVASC